LPLDVKQKRIRFSFELCHKLIENDNKLHRLDIPISCLSSIEGQLGEGLKKVNGSKFRVRVTPLFEIKNHKSISYGVKSLMPAGMLCIAGGMQNLHR
jgi:hypothetical protein